MEIHLMIFADDDFVSAEKFSQRFSVLILYLRQIGFQIFCGIAYRVLAQMLSRAKFKAFP